MFGRMSEQVDTTTADQVRVEFTVAVRYRTPFHYTVVPERVADVLRELGEAEARFRSSIGAAARAQVARLSFDELCGKRAGVASAVRRELGPVMIGSGYQLLHARVTDSFRWAPVVPLSSGAEGAPRGVGAGTGASAGDAVDLSRWQGEGGGTGSSPSANTTVS